MIRYKDLLFLSIFFWLFFFSFLVTVAPTLIMQGSYNTQTGETNIYLDHPVVIRHEEIHHEMRVFLWWRKPIFLLFMLALGTAWRVKNTFIAEILLLMTIWIKGIGELSAYVLSGDSLFNISKIVALIIVNLLYCHSIFHEKALFTPWNKLDKHQYGFILAFGLILLLL